MKLTAPPLLAVLALSAGSAMAQRPQSLAAKAEVSASDFMAQNAQAQGIKSLSSGLQHKVLRSGPSPKAGDIVKIEYEGTLPSGVVFDSTVARGKPVLMRLNGLVGAWMEALPLMRVGEE